MDKVSKNELLTAARLFDRGKWQEAYSELLDVPIRRRDRSQRIVAIALWKRVVANYAKIKPDAAFDSGATISALTAINSVILNPEKSLDALHQIPILENALGVPATAAIFATTFWDTVLDAKPPIIAPMLELFFKDGRKRCIDGWQQFLAARPEFIPGYRQFILFAMTLIENDTSALRQRTLASVENAGRQDLVPLIGVYTQIMQQDLMPEIAAAARALTNRTHRLFVATYLIDASFMPADLQIAAALYFDLVGASEDHRAEIGLMKMRLANAEQRWRDVLILAKIAASKPDFRPVSKLLQAHALARLGEVYGADALLDDVTSDHKATPYDDARVVFLRVTTELMRSGIPAHEDRPPKIFPPVVGRPLAQSLWVGRRLRWIEQLAIKSYLDNGWRFQLYAYDDPENVPDGCEVLDGTAILPMKDVFKEGKDSGVHAGSIGAFSDLFRYKLLFEKGGMWTDTDVINFRKFEPDGQKFVSTEIHDAGLVSINGAMMAAPARDKFMKAAFDRAHQILASGDRMFFTRIGPYLLAELIAEFGVREIDFMRPDFLSPISWMNTALLFQPFERVNTRPEFQNVTNVHVYTETWRMCGLRFDKPPGTETYLGKLYADHFPENVNAQK